jgi:pilus assembly protein CpaC
MFTGKHLGKNAQRAAAASGLWLAAAVWIAPQPAKAQGAEELRLTVGKSVVIDYPEDIRQISTTDPNIVDASPVTTREILLNAKGLGTATMVVWSASNQRMFYNVTVDLNTESLKRILRDTFPNDTIEVRTSGESISLNGMVSTKEVSDRAAALAGVTAKTVVNNLSLPPEKVAKQILLHVKFAQLDRSKAESYGINFQSSGAFNFLGALQTAATAGPQLSGTFRNIALSGQLKALQERQIVQILAEPTLVTRDGKEGSFLVGGEIPVPVVQGGGNSNAVTVLYREYGIRLRYTPEITENNTIKLLLSQEVSSLDYANGATIANFLVPGLQTRRAETNVELAEGETFAVAGLLDSRDREIFARIPGISSVPIIGNLFKNKQSLKQSSELIMLVTPEITMPLTPNDAKPELNFPNEFLPPVTPEESAAARKAAK